MDHRIEIDYVPGLTVGEGESTDERGISCCSRPVGRTLFGAEYDQQGRSPKDDFEKTVQLTS